MRKALAVIFSLLLSIASPALVLAQGTCGIYQTFVTGDSLTASGLNSLQTTLGQTNMVQPCLDGYGNTTGQFDEALTPEAGGARVVSTTLNHDIVNLRYAVRHAMGFSQWWRAPYEDINFGHRSVRMHYGVITDQYNPMWAGRAHYWGGAVRQHLVSYSVSSYSVGTMHPESVMFLLHVGAADGAYSGTGTFATPSVRFQVGIGGDVHVGNTLMVHAAGTFTHAAIFRAPSPATGISWPVANHLAISSINITGTLLSNPFENPAEVARFHLGGIFLARSHVNATTPPRNTLSNSNLVKAWALIDANGQLMDGYNISAARRTGAGTFTVEWLNPFTSANYGVVCSLTEVAGDGVAAADLYCNVASTTASQVTLRLIDAGGAAAAGGVSVLAIGAQ